MNDSAVDKENETVSPRSLDNSDRDVSSISTASAADEFPLPATDAPVEELIEARRRIVWGKPGHG